MEMTIIFGRVGYFKSHEETCYNIDYMSPNGCTHRDRISLELYNKIKAKNFEPGSDINASFDIDPYNKLTLIDILF